MTFTYEYREASGAIAKRVAEAASRAELLERLKAEKISPISIREGSHLPSGAKKPIPKVALHGAMGGAVVCIGAVLLWWFLSGGEKPETGGGAPKAKTAKTTKVPTSHKVERKAETAEQPAVAKATKPPKEKNTNRVEKLPDGREIRINEKGEKILCVNPVDPNAPVPKSIFKHDVESALAMYVKPAVMMPPPPRDYTDEEVRQALAEPVEVDMNEDDEDTIFQKKTVQAFKDELREFLENGGTFSQYMRQLQKRQEVEAAQTMQSRKMIEKCLDENKPEEARELFDALNKHLEKQGIPPIKMAPKYRHLLH